MVVLNSHRQRTIFIVLASSKLSHENNHSLPIAFTSPYQDQILLRVQRWKSVGRNSMAILKIKPKFQLLIRPYLASWRFPGLFCGSEPGTIERLHHKISAGLEKPRDNHFYESNNVHSITTQDSTTDGFLLVALSNLLNG